MKITKKLPFDATKETELFEIFIDSQNEFVNGFKKALVHIEESGLREETKKELNRVLGLAGLLFNMSVTAMSLNLKISKSHLSKELISMINKG